jgi:hypothetical protein
VSARGRDSGGREREREIERERGTETLPTTTCLGPNPVDVAPTGPFSVRSPRPSSIQDCTDRPVAVAMTPRVSSTVNRSATRSWSWWDSFVAPHEPPDDDNGEPPRVRHEQGDHALATPSHCVCQEHHGLRCIESPPCESRRRGFHEVTEWSPSSPFTRRTWFGVAGGGCRSHVARVTFHRRRPCSGRRPDA